MSQQQSQLPDALAKLQELRQGGVLTEEEFMRAKERLLQAPSSDTLTVEEADAMLERVDRVERHATLAELQLELSRLEHNWQSEESALVTLEDGQKKIPSMDDAQYGTALFAVQGIVLFGLTIFLWFSTHSILYLVLCGGFSLYPFLMVHWNLSYWRTKVTRYEEARHGYEEQRKKIEAKIREVERRK